jgi:hypothetical protein
VTEAGITGGRYLPAYKASYVKNDKYTHTVYPNLWLHGPHTVPRTSIKLTRRIQTNEKIRKVKEFKKIKTKQC